MSKDLLDDLKTKYFIRVYKKNEFNYDVGPFDSFGGSDVLGLQNSAMAWVYQQIGLLATHYPEEKLVKDRWDYQVGGGFLPKGVFDVRVSFAAFSFEVLELVSTRHLVVEELIKNIEHDGSF